MLVGILCEMTEIAMFGYVKVNSDELLVREYELYKAIYCGTCRAMKKCTGCLSSFSLRYDFVFLSLVRMALSEDSDNSLKVERHRCIAHPLKKRNMVVHPELDYAARSAAVLSYLKIKDDIADSGFLRRIACYMALPVFSNAKRRAKLPSLCEDAAKDIKRLSEFEKRREESVDIVADVFGELLARIFSFGIDGVGADIAHGIGYRLGKIIYELDALDDYPRDVKSGSYNPYVCLYGSDGIGDRLSAVRSGIMLELSALENEIMRIDFGERCAVEHIIKNTLYLGLTRELDRICRGYEENNSSRKEKKNEQISL